MLFVLLGAGVVYAVTSSSNGTEARQPVVASGSKPWLGVEMSTSPAGGAVVLAVVPGSPAAGAGIRPGDVITQLDTEPIATPATLVSAISGMRPGDGVDIQLQRGSSHYTAHVVLASGPGRSP